MADEPTARGGARRAPNPEQELLAALRGIAYVAEVRGVAEQSIRTALTRARQAEENTGTWPAGPGRIPKPDVEGRGFSVQWDSRREDFQDYCQPKSSRYPQLYDREWLARRYPHRSVSAIAREVGCSRAYVLIALERAGFRMKDTPYATYVLHGVPLQELEDAMRDAGSVEAAAAYFGHTVEAFKRALARGRRSAGGPTEEDDRLTA